MNFIDTSSAMSNRVIRRSAKAHENFINIQNIFEANLTKWVVGEYEFRKLERGKRPHADRYGYTP